MRELDDSNWFSKWEDELPSPEDLMPLSQSLITPHLALAFNIPNPHHHAADHPLPPPPQSSQPNSSSEFDSPELTATATADEAARTLKRPRLVWTPQLHKRFVDAVAHLGIKNAVPKTIMQLMSVDGLTRENVASHLQKYRLYLKRMQGISNNNSSSVSGMDSATDHLFASSPVPAHFLHPGNRASSEHYLPFVPMAAAMQHSHHQLPPQVVVGQQQGQFRQFDQQLPFIRQPQRMVGTPQVRGSNGVPPVYATTDNLESANGRKVLTLFPNGND